MTENISRRHFLKTGCVVAAAAGVLVCGGGGLAATYQPPIDKPSTTFGDKTMDQRILITYATKAGSTGEVAARLGENLAKQNLAVDVLPVAKVNDLSPYAAVIAGSAIRMGKILPEMQQFVENNQAALQKMPFNFYILCMTLHEDTPENRQTVSAYLDPVRAVVKPANEGLFAGVMDPNRLPLFERLIIMAMKTPRGDFRQWDKIEGWAGAQA